MRKYVAYQVQGECAMGVCEGWRAFVATCDKPYYQGRSYRDALRTYKEEVRFTDGVEFAVMLMGYNPEHNEWDVIKDNEINQVSKS